MSDMAAARLNMVESQVRPNQVTDPRILNAMLEIPRELFVPEALRSLAYMDEDVALLAAGDREPARVLMAPMPLAQLIQLCGVESGDLVLDVGCASGYSTAVFSALAGGVVGLECHQGLADQARKTLEDLGADNVDIVTGPLEAGHAQAAPYDVIMLGGSAPEISPTLRSQLKEGGKLVAIIVENGIGRAHLFEKVGGEMSGRAVFEATAPELPGFEREARFTFV